MLANPPRTRVSARGIAASKVVILRADLTFSPPEAASLRESIPSDLGVAERFLLDCMEELSCNPANADAWLVRFYAAD